MKNSRVFSLHLVATLVLAFHTRPGLGQDEEELPLPSGTDVTEDPEDFQCHYCDIMNKEYGCKDDLITSNRTCSSLEETGCFSMKIDFEGEKLFKVIAGCFCPLYRKCFQYFIEKKFPKESDCYKGRIDKKTLKEFQDCIMPGNYSCTKDAPQPDISDPEEAAAGIWELAVGRPLHESGGIDTKEHVKIYICYCSESLCNTNEFWKGKHTSVIGDEVSGKGRSSEFNVALLGVAVLPFLFH